MKTQIQPALYQQFRILVVKWCWGIFSRHILIPLVSTVHHLNATAYLIIVAGHVYHFHDHSVPIS